MVLKKTGKAIPTPLSDDALLKALFSQPTAPFREMHVMKPVLHELIAGRVPHFQDAAGNIVVGVANKTEYLRLVRTRSKEPLRFFIAHMDHPGFHGVRWKTAERLEVKWHGGAPVKLLEQAPVWLADTEGVLGEGHLENAKLTASGRTIDTAEVVFRVNDQREENVPAESIFGGFRFREPFWEENSLIYTRAADDLSGVFSIVTLAKELFAKRRKPASIPFIGLLSRAEEVGFIGTLAHFEEGWLENAKRPIQVVSLEASRTLPGAEIGKGPIVRQGDRLSVFSSSGIHALTQIAERRLKTNYQKRIMDGGSCEASAAIAYGFPAIGISVPLGNYHNQSFEGGPGSAGPLGPAPEFVHRNDLKGMLELCRGIMFDKVRWDEPFLEKKREYQKLLKSYRPFLKQRANR